MLVILIAVDSGGQNNQYRQDPDLGPEHSSILEDSGSLQGNDANFVEGTRIIPRKYIF